MEWSNLIAQRRTIYRWNNQVPSRNLIDQVVDEVHNYCPSKQKKVPFWIDVIDNTDPNIAPAAVELLEKNKTFIQKHVAAWIANNVQQGVAPFTGYVYDAAKCERDVGYIVAALRLCVRYGTNQYIRDYAKTYWTANGQPRVRQFAELATYTYVKDLILNHIFTGAPVQQLQSQAVQFINPALPVEASAITRVSTDIEALRAVIANGWNSLPALVQGTTRKRMKIWESVDRKGLGKIDDIRNPQVLAPWLMVFSYRNLTLNEIGLNSELKMTSFLKEISQNEIGISSIFAMLSAEDKGIDTAFCACIRNKAELATMLGHTVEEEPVVVVGMGHKDTTPGNTYFNPLICDVKNIPDSNFDTRPPKDKYIRYHVA